MPCRIIALIVAALGAFPTYSDTLRDILTQNRIQLSLPDRSTPVEARLVRQSLESDGRRAITLAIDDVLSVVTVSPDGDMLAHIWTSDLDAYSVESTDAGDRIRRVVDEPFACRLLPRPPGAVAASSRKKRRVVAPFRDAEIRVLLLRVNGEMPELPDSAVALRFGHAIDLMNAALANSALGWIKFTAAGVDRVDLPAGVEDDPDHGALRWVADPRNTAVNALRQQYRADLVTLAAQRAPLDVTFARPFPGHASSEYGFVVLRSLLTGNDTSGGNNDYAMVALHEWGHALGGDHNPEDEIVPSGEDPAPYARCFHGCGASPPWRGPLAYSAHCSADGTCVSFCARSPSRYPLFSNPDVKFRGIAAGVPERQDNARAFRQIAPLVARYIE